VVHGAILLFVAVYSDKFAFHTSVADASGQSSEATIFRHENGDDIYENDFDGIVGGRRSRLQIHREKQIRALLLENEIEVEPSKLSDEVEQQDPDQPSVDNIRSLSHGVKGPRKDKVDVVQEDDVVAMGGKKGKKKKGKSWDATEHGYDGCVCVKYELPSSKSSKGSGKSGKKGENSKGSKSDGSKGGVDHDSNWERHRALLSDEKGEEKIEGQEPDEADENLHGRRGARKNKIADTDDLVVLASWNDEHGHEKKKKKHFDEPDEEAVCVKWECIPEVM
jgi:hypothetical protein